MSKTSKESQTPFRFAPVVKERLKKLAHYQGVDMVVIVSMLINKEYMDNKDAIEEFLKDNPMEVKSTEKQ